MEQSTPARLYALLVGGGLVILGVVGFFYASGFDAGDSVCVDDGCDDVFGILAVNGWHNLIHIATGAIGLIAVTYGVAATRAFALYIGTFYLLLALLGFIELGSGDFPDTILKLIPSNAEDNFFHLIIGVLGVGAALASPKEGMPARRTPETSQ